MTAAKKSRAKPHIVVDVLGLLMVVAVTTAALDDGTGAPLVLEILSAQEHPRLVKWWGDNNYNKEPRQNKLPNADLSQLTVNDITVGCKMQQS